MTGDNVASVIVVSGPYIYTAGRGGAGRVEAMLRRVLSLLVLCAAPPMHRGE